MKRQAATLAAVLGFAVPSSATAHHAGGCFTRSCDARVGHKRGAAKKRTVIRPYRAWLAKVRYCESRGNWRTNTGNGFYGAYQFTLSSWRAVGGRGLPHLASPLEQMYRAVLLLRLQGPGAWPRCGA